MDPLIWQVVYNLDGGILETGPGPSNDRFGEVGQGGSGTPLANHYVREAIGGHNAKTARGQAAAGVGADLFYTAMHNMNIVAADHAEQRKLKSLSPQVRQLMPRSYGGVLVASTYAFHGSARSFVDSYVVGAAPLPKPAVQSYLARGSVRGPDMRQKLWRVTVKRAKRADPATPVISSWR